MKQRRLGRTGISVSEIGLVTHPDQLGEHLAAAEVTLPADALAACDAISKEIRYPME